MTLPETKLIVPESNIEFPDIYARGFGKLATAGLVHYDAMAFAERLIVPNSDYAGPDSDVAPYNFPKIINATQAKYKFPHSLHHLVVFESQLDESVSDDAKAEIEAKQSLDLIYYSAGVADSAGTAASFCYWTNEESAQVLSKGASHKAAREMVKYYKWYKYSAYEVSPWIKNGAMRLIHSRTIDNRPKESDQSLQGLAEAA
jgi:hypothetical protein